MISDERIKQIYSWYGIDMAFIRHDSLCHKHVLWWFNFIAAKQSFRRRWPRHRTHWQRTAYRMQNNGKIELRGYAARNQSHSIDAVQNFRRCCGNAADAQYNQTKMLLMHFQLILMQKLSSNCNINRLGPFTFCRHFSFTCWPCHSPAFCICSSTSGCKWAEPNMSWKIAKNDTNSSKSTSREWTLTSVFV